MIRDDKSTDNEEKSPPGLEPGLQPPEGYVLPLHNGPPKNKKHAYESRDGFEPPTPASKAGVLTNYTNRTSQYQKKGKKKRLPRRESNPGLNGDNVIY